MGKKVIIPLVVLCWSESCLGAVGVHDSPSKALGEQKVVLHPGPVTYASHLCRVNIEKIWGRAAQLH